MRPASSTCATTAGRIRYESVADIPGGFINASINVHGAFTGGRSSSGTQTDHQDHYELQNYTSISQGKHFVKFGGRLRAVHEVNTSGAGFNGIYTFPDLATYRLRYKTPATGNPIQLKLDRLRLPAVPVPTVPVTVVDAGLYVQDDWKVRPNFHAERRAAL